MPATIQRVNQKEKIITTDGTIFYGELDSVNKKIIRITQENGVVVPASVDMDPIKINALGEAFTAFANFAIAEFAPPVTP